MQTITPFLWFDDNAEEAIEFYASIFEDSAITSMQRQQDGQLMSAQFELNGQSFMALNGGSEFIFNEAISMFVSCDSQEEVDELWEKLATGGSEGRCGWLKDKFGLSWQIIPKSLGEFLGNPDPEKAGRALQAMLGMNKIDTEELRRASEGIY